MTEPTKHPMTPSEELEDAARHLLSIRPDLLESEPWARRMKAAFDRCEAEREADSQNPVSVFGLASEKALNLAKRSQWGPTEIQKFLDLLPRRFKPERQLEICDKYGVRPSVYANNLRLLCKDGLKWAEARAKETNFDAQEFEREMDSLIANPDQELSEEAKNAPIPARLSNIDSAMEEILGKNVKFYNGGGKSRFQ